MTKRILNLFGVPIHSVTLTEAISVTVSWIHAGRTGKLIFTPNPEIILKAKDNPAYRSILRMGSLLIPDGYGLVLASKVLGGPLKKQVTGVDFLTKLFSYAEQHRLRCYVVLSSHGLTSPQRARSFFIRAYPNLEVCCQSVTLHERESGHLVSDIREQAPDILIVTFGAPHQEVWLTRTLPKLPRVNIGVAVGGAIDMLSNTVRRAPMVFQILHLEWFWRFLNSPKRFRRIVNAVAIFPLTIAKLALVSRFRFRKNVLAFVFMGRNRILVIEKLFGAEKGFYWTLPQGGVRSGETEEAALRRELREETGARTTRIVARSRFTNKYTWPWYAKNVYNFMYAGQHQSCFFVTFEGSERELTMPKEGSEYIRSFRWVDQTELLKLVLPPRRVFVTKLLSEFNGKKIYKLR